MKCPECKKDFEPCSMCRCSEPHQQCVNDIRCGDCTVNWTWGINKKLFIVLRKLGSRESFYSRNIPHLDQTKLEDELTYSILGYTDTDTEAVELIYKKDCTLLN